MPFFRKLCLEIIQKDHGVLAAMPSYQRSLREHHCSGQHLLLPATDMGTCLAFFESQTQFRAVWAGVGVAHLAISFDSGVERRLQTLAFVPAGYQLQPKSIHPQQKFEPTVRLVLQQTQVSAPQGMERFACDYQFRIPDLNLSEWKLLSKGLVALPKSALIPTPESKEGMFHVEQSPIDVTTAIDRTVLENPMQLPVHKQDGYRFSQFPPRRACIQPVDGQLTFPTCNGPSGRRRMPVVVLDRQGNPG